MGVWGEEKKKSNNEKKGEKMNDKEKFELIDAVTLLFDRKVITPKQADKLADKIREIEWGENKCMKTESSI